MFHRILVGYDGSTGSRAALAAGLWLAAESGGSVTAVTVQHHLPRYGATVSEVDEEREVEAAQARRLANEIEAEAAEHDVPVATKIAVGHAAQELVRAAKAVDADLIVLGHSGHSGAWGGLLGGVTRPGQPPCPVLGPDRPVAAMSPATQGRPHLWQISAVTRASGRVKTLGTVLIVVTGLLTFHPPHFLLEGRHATTAAACLLEIGLAVNLVATLVAATAIWRGTRLGWILGIVIAAVAIGLYLAQQTIGLPGLPKNWVEPSRIVALVTQALFIALAIRHLHVLQATPPLSRTRCG